MLGVQQEMLRNIESSIWKLDGTFTRIWKWMGAHSNKEAVAFPAREERGW